MIYKVSAHKPQHINAIINSNSIKHLRCGCFLLYLKTPGYFRPEKTSGSLSAKISAVFYLHICFCHVFSSLYSLLNLFQRGSRPGSHAYIDTWIAVSCGTGEVPAYVFCTMPGRPLLSDFESTGFCSYCE